MIFTLNNYLLYSFNKFSCRPRFECLLSFKSKFGEGSKLDSTNTSNVRKTRTLPNYSLKNQLQNQNQLKFKNSFVFSRREEKTSLFFKNQALLCYHDDLNFLNLGFYFLNTLKALHCCWSAVKNNKRVAFVGVEHDLVGRALDGCLKTWFKSKNFIRDTLPRTNNNESGLKLTSKGKFKHQKQTGFKFKFDGLLTTNARILKKRTFAKPQPQLNLRNFENERRVSRESSYYKLMAKRMKAHAGLNSFVIKQSHLSLLANPDQSLKVASSHVSLLQAKKAFNWSNLNGRVSHGLKARLANFETGYSSAATNEEFKPSLAKTFLNSSNFRFGTKLTLKKFFKNNFVQNAQSQQRELNYFPSGGTNTLKSSLKKQKTKSVLFSLKKKSKLKTKNPKKRNYEKFRFYCRYRKQTGQKRKTSAHLNLMPNFVYEPFYSNLLNRIQFYDKFHFAKNPYFKQADVIFFSHPDKTLSMANQAKNLRIPSIGIESALKSRKEHVKYASMRSTVNMPLLGNPDNSFFVLLLLRLFMRLSSHACFW